jgi:hypothetical protein
MDLPPTQHTPGLTGVNIAAITDPGYAGEFAYSLLARTVRTCRKLRPAEHGRNQEL